MAIIMKKEPEKDIYTRINIEKCFINQAGLYLTMTVYKNKSERDKEKLREKELSEFVNSASKRNEELMGDEEIAQADKSKIYEDYLNDALYIASQIDSIVYDQYFFPEFLEQNPNFQKPERITLTVKQYEAAKRFGFKKEWYDDPILIVREEIFLTDSYKKQDFSLDSFYESFKENILNLKGREIPFEDDL
jgi:hypothetical protein